jgi:hypothetical protein
MFMEDEVAKEPSTSRKASNPTLSHKSRKVTRKMKEQIASFGNKRWYLDVC